MHGSVDAGYRDKLIGRFQLYQRKKVRALSKGNRQRCSLSPRWPLAPTCWCSTSRRAGWDPLMEVVFRQTALEAKGRGHAEFLSEQVSRPESITGRHPPVTTKRARHA
jgi:hypothetical protein